MNIGIIDADLIYRKNHRFPNLALMKISKFYKEKGHNVSLITDYNNPYRYDKIFLSQVFTDTIVPENITSSDNVIKGGTGIYFDKAPRLPEEMEHISPDYTLYNEFVNEQRAKGVRENKLREFCNVSIGFSTRGCIRKCKFCVNQNYNKSSLHSPIKEFFDPARRSICLLDDNVFACRDWKYVFDSLIETKHSFYFKQGLDERLLDEEKCDYLFNKSLYYSDYVFAFDNYKDKDIIEKKLNMIKYYTDKQCRFYTLCAFNHENPGRYSNEFWLKDIVELFERIIILMKYKCIPFVMKYKDFELSPYRGLYIDIARWCNQPSMFKTKTFREWLYLVGENTAAFRYANEFEKLYPDIAHKYYDISFLDF